MPRPVLPSSALGAKGIERLVVFLSHIDVSPDPELRDLIELEVRELLKAYGYPDDDLPVIRGSALDESPAGQVTELLQVLGA